MSKKQTIHYFQERKGWLVLKNFYDELNPSVVMEITHTIFYFYFVTWALMNFYFLLHFFFLGRKTPTRNSSELDMCPARKTESSVVTEAAVEKTRNRSVCNK